MIVWWIMTVSVPSSREARILRAFGAGVGNGLVCEPRFTIKYPWFLEIDDHVRLGEMFWPGNHTMVKIGRQAVAL